MAINSQKFLPSTKGSSLAKFSKISNSKVSSLNFSEKSLKDINIIRVKVVEIDKLLRGTLASQKKELDNKKRESSKKRLSSSEEKLESKNDVKSNKIKMPESPKIGFIDRIKDFIGKMILGFFVYRLIDHLPKIMPIIRFIGGATDFIVNIGGKLLNGLVTFVDWGYKAYDATKGFLKSIGGDNFVKIFDTFNGTMGTLIDTAIIATIAIASQGEGGLLDTGMDMLRDKVTGKGAKAVATKGATAAKSAGVGAGAAAAIVAGAGLLASALGEGAFQLRKIALNPIKKLENDQKQDKNPITRFGRGVALKVISPFMSIFSIAGNILDIIGAPFRYAIELIRYPFLSEEDKQKQVHNLAKFDARIREDFRKALNMLTLGLAFKEKGSFGNIYGNKNAQKEMMGKMQGGGAPITRGGKTFGNVKRTLKKGKYKRRLEKKPGEIDIKAGADVGGEEKLFDLFPKPEVPGFMNPFGVIKKSGKELGKSDYFGPILAITSKILLGQKPSQNDYKNVGIGINSLLSNGINSGKIKGGLIAAFAEGGFVDPETLSAIGDGGGDITDWVAKSFKEATETNSQKTLREIQQNLKLKKDEKKDGKGVDDIDNGIGGEGSEGGIQGSGVDKAVSVAKKLIVDLGITPAQASGIVGNFLYESAGMNPGEREGSPYGTPEKPPTLGTVGVGYGWAQWTNSRPGDRLDKFLKSYGGDKGKIATDDDNYRFLMKELKGSESLNRKGVITGTYFPKDDPQAASDWFRRNWERAGVPADEKRRKETLDVFNRIKGLTREQAKADVIKTGGKIYNGRGEKMGSKSIKSVDDFNSIARGFGLTLYSSYRPGSSGWHGADRARDYSNDGIGLGTPEQLSFARYAYQNYGAKLKELIYTPLGFGVKNGKKVPLTAWGPVTKSKWAGGGTGTNAIHYDHVHVAYAEGGKTLDSPHLALLGEKGKEIVIKNKVLKTEPEIEKMLLAINQSNDKSSIVEAIRDYAPYDVMIPQTNIIPSEDYEDEYMSDSRSSGGLVFIPIGDESSNLFETLYPGG